jgi:plastocyanin
MMKTSRHNDSVVFGRALRRAAVAMLLLLTAIGCFSERSAPTGTAQVLGECTVPLGADVIGATFVAIRGFGFKDQEVRIARGTRVAWVNCESSATEHTVTADDGSYDSTPLAVGKAFARTFPTAGTFAYHCEPHPFMKGTIVVQ